MKMVSILKVVPLKQYVFQDLLDQKDKVPHVLKKC